MVGEGLITKNEALLRIEPNQIDNLLHKQLDPKAKAKERSIAKGLPASPGAAVGKVVFDPETAVEMNEKKEKVILVRDETSPEDIHGMAAAEGILTARGGMTSHAAIVGRSMGKPCVVGCEELSLDEEKRRFSVNGVEVRENEVISIDGGTGQVFRGELPVVDVEIKGEFETLMGWVNQKKKLAVRTNADTPQDSERARNFGAEGIGLCRTEHMFFEEERLRWVRKMILADDEEGRRKALDKILPMQKQDFVGIFRAMNGLPVTIRLLDPPLHEFLPKEDKEIKRIAKDIGFKPEDLKKKVEYLSEFNPMLGFRGCRLGIVYPEITQMQTRAIIEAAIEVTKEGRKTIPEIEIPVVGSVEEIKFLKDTIKKVADELIKGSGVKIDYKIGTMIELPRACVVADELAKFLDFMSFGTNDLTQTTYGFSRDDAGKFIPKYIEKGILKDDPFQILDQDGVGSLMKICVKLARRSNPKIEIGICGEHGGEPSSVEFCHSIGLDYVSCSPFRVPVARLAAARANLKKQIE